MTKPVAELLVVVYNDQKNAREGSSNVPIRVPVNDVAQIKETILAQYISPGALLEKRPGSVVVKYGGKMYLCERDFAKKGYARHTVEYHPFMKQFTI
jgi:hypothetical protein